MNVVVTASLTSNGNVLVGVENRGTFYDRYRFAVVGFDASGEETVVFEKSYPRGFLANSGNVVSIPASRNPFWRAASDGRPYVAYALDWSAEYYSPCAPQKTETFRVPVARAR